MGKYTGTAQTGKCSFDHDDDDDCDGGYGTCYIIALLVKWVVIHKSALDCITMHLFFFEWVKLKYKYCFWGRIACRNAV